MFIQKKTNKQKKKNKQKKNKQTKKKKQTNKKKTKKPKKSLWRLSLVKVFVILKAPYERIRINFIALTASTSKMQTRINYLFSTNFTVFDDFAFYIDMIDSDKIVGAFWIAKLMWNTTIFFVKFPYLKNS